MIIRDLLNSPHVITLALIISRALVPYNYNHVTAIH